MKYLSLLLIFISVQLHALTFKSDGTVVKSDGTVVESPKELSTSNSSSSGKSCSARGDITDPVIAPIWENYQREYSDSRVDKILFNRKTINVFLVLFLELFNENKYQLVIGAGPGNYHPQKKDSEKTIQLFEEFWYAHYENTPENKFFKEKNQFITKSKFKHNDTNPTEYGNTYQINFLHPEYSDVLSNYIISREQYGSHGTYFDWWHNSFYGKNKTQVANFRKLLIEKIRRGASDDFLLLGNVNWEMNTADNNLNGVLLELYKKPFNRLNKYKCSEINNMEKLIQFHNHNLLYPKLIAFEPWRISSSKKYEYFSDQIEDRTTDQNIKYAKLFTAMSAVIPEHGYILYTDNGPELKADHRHHYYDFYNIDMGKPISLMTPIMEGVAYKKYERGIIAYNRLPIAVAVQFPSGRVETLEAYSGNFFWDDPQEELENQKLLYN